MTKKEYFESIRAIVADHPELVAFCDHEIELLDARRNSPRKPTKVQEANEILKNEIVMALTFSTEPVTIPELVKICDALAGCTNQKISALLTALRKEHKVMRTYVKRIAYFSLGDEGEGVA